MWISERRLNKLTRRLDLLESQVNKVGKPSCKETMMVPVPDGFFKRASWPIDSGISYRKEVEIQVVVNKILQHLNLSFKYTEATPSILHLQANPSPTKKFNKRKTAKKR